MNELFIFIMFLNYIENNLSFSWWTWLISFWIDDIQVSTTHRHYEEFKIDLMNILIGERNDWIIIEIFAPALMCRYLKWKIRVLNLKNAELLFLTILIGPLVMYAICCWKGTLLFKKREGTSYLLKPLKKWKKMFNWYLCIEQDAVHVVLHCVVFFSTTGVYIY